MAVGVTGFEDPENEAPWAMPIAFVAEKQSPATVTAICEASAKAVVALLAHPATLSGEWRPLVERWTAGRIRKVVRRGTPAHFARAEHLPGVTVEHAGAKVRAFVPGPTDQLPADLKRLQVSGSEPPELGTPSEGALVSVMVNPALSMSVGKTAAQVSHAAQLAWMQMDPVRRFTWEVTGFSVRVVHPSPEEWELLLPSAKVRVVDAGFTEIPPGSNTAVAVF